MNFIRKEANLPNLLTVLLVLEILLWPNERPRVASPEALLVAVGAFFLLFQYHWHKPGAGKHIKTIADIGFGVLVVWELVAAKYNLLAPALLPSLENIFNVAVDKYPLILWGTVRSFGLLVGGFLSATVLGIALGLWVGWNPRLRNAALPIARILNAIPPLIYTTYAIALMPSFLLASIFILFNGVFWGTLSNMAHQVGTIDRRTVDSARTMNVSGRTMLFQVIFPASLPGIIGRFHVAITTSFLLLTGAEMVGADAGIGWFVRSFYGLGRYPEVFFGIFYIGLVITVVNSLMVRLEKRLLVWMPQRAESS